MTISPDSVIYFYLGPFPVNATLLFTWIVMGVLVLTSWLVTRTISSDLPISPWQNFLEITVSAIQRQIKEVSNQEARHYIPFIGTLFLFVLTSNVLSVFPGFSPPTGSFSTTVALAICVFIAVPIFGVASKGWRAYLQAYIKPTFIMLPFNIIGEISRTLALAVRLYGNMMSGTVIVAILLGVVPLFFPVVMHVLGLLTGVIQAYIFSILAIVYIASASKSAQRNNHQSTTE
jgi:F-type H+-transporting ATPase subunit a